MNTINNPTMNKIAPGAASFILLSAPRKLAVQLIEPAMPFKKSAIPPIIAARPSTIPNIEYMKIGRAHV